MKDRLIEIIKQCACHYSPPCDGDCGLCNNVEMYDDQIEHIADAIIESDIIKRCHKQSEWISVDERLPNLDPFGKGRYGGPRSVRVLCACKQKDGRTFVKEGYYEPCCSGIVWRIPGSIDSVTHWMPLPEPPKGE